MAVLHVLACIMMFLVLLLVHRVPEAVLVQPNPWRKEQKQGFRAGQSESKVWTKAEIKAEASHKIFNGIKHVALCIYWPSSLLPFMPRTPGPNQTIALITSPSRYVTQPSSILMLIHCECAPFTAWTYP